MNVAEIMKERRVFSLEVFPPKTNAGMEKLCGAGGVLENLYSLNPDYISCTYGAGGTNVGRNMEVLDKIRRDGRAVALTHFTCISNTREDIRRQMGEYLAHGITHLLALRGDIPYGWTGTCGDFSHASQLVSFIRGEYGSRFVVAVSGSPEGHIESRRFEDDIKYLKLKQDEGADYVMTQLCWDMDQFRRWMDAIRAAGVTLPVDVGVMPVLDAAAIINMSLSRNGCVMPRALAEIISRHWIFPNPFNPGEPEEAVAAKKAAFREEGLEYTAKLIREYLDCGVAGIHLYALNRFENVALLARETGLTKL